MSFVEEINYAVDEVADKITIMYNKLRGFFPRAMPQGMTEFNVWADRIIHTYNPPMAKRSVKFTLSALLMRLGPTEAYKSDYYFALSLRRGAAAQVGAYVMEDIKKEQAEEYAAQLEAAQLEATEKVSSNEQQQSLAI